MAFCRKPWRSRGNETPAEQGAPKFTVSGWRRFSIVIARLVRATYSRSSAAIGGPNKPSYNEMKV